MKGYIVKWASIFGFLAGASSAQALQIGEMVPDVAVPVTSGGEVNLRNTDGQWTVVFFYPKAFTPGCTSQACSMRDSNKQLMDLGVRVFGASTDSLQTQRDFKAKNNLPYELLADDGKELSKGFGILGMIGFTSRTTFIIDPEGRIADMIESVSVGSHDADVIRILKKHLAQDG